MIALDTNILVYAEATSDTSDRHVAARSLILQLGPTGAVVPLQVLAEFLNVCRRKAMLAPDSAIARMASYAEIFDTPETQQADLTAAATMAARFGLAFFDALICTVSQRAGAQVLLSEDMADGMIVDQLRICNPFMPRNRDLLNALLGA